MLSQSWSKQQCSLDNLDKVADSSRKILSASPPIDKMSRTTTTLRDCTSQQQLLQGGGGGVESISRFQHILLSEKDAQSCGSESSEAMILDECVDLNEDEKSVSTLQKSYCVTSPKHGTTGGSQGGAPGDFYSLSFNDSQHFLKNTSPLSPSLTKNLQSPTTWRGVERGIMESNQPSSFLNHPIFTLSKIKTVQEEEEELAEPFLGSTDKQNDDVESQKWRGAKQPDGYYWSLFRKRQRLDKAGRTGTKTPYFSSQAAAEQSFSEDAYSAVSGQTKLSKVCRILLSIAIVILFLVVFSLMIQSGLEVNQRGASTEEEEEEELSRTTEIGQLEDCIDTATVVDVAHSPE